MVQAGTAHLTNSDKFIESIVKYISGKEDLLRKLQDLLVLYKFEKKGKNSDESTINDMSKFLMENKDFFGGCNNSYIGRF
ncbi:hypothetical protein [Wolbachia endosymbiont of Trichogramma pretiosum]|uniref:hypothetical protein n=1 Tax=Wolbachia endosymbiont of Trichogramma pretiosum TaxID=125593 RepID=UPI0008395B40|nr:hypothetical protein [Wolbachia endosymbiont of Trichogramma pretiosum]OCA06592.1 hypothetical protein wTpre_931 [Wolbachia endosymbiont of Trichogramma pretiosum]